jgi:hypothetical protein
MIALKVDQNSFEPRQLAGVDPDPLADFKVGPRLSRNFGSNSQLNGLNFPILDGHWRSAATNYLQNSRSHYRRAPLRVFESTKDVSREKRSLDFFFSV